LFEKFYRARRSETLREKGQGLAGDKRYESLILEPLEVLGVDSFGPSEVVIRCLLKTLPQKQWGAGRELRKRIVSGFIDKGIEIPYQNVSVSPGGRAGLSEVRLEGRKAGSPGRGLPRTRICTGI
jgi:small conductance mechanosensitive channel